jgi:hypothetical protein
MLGVNIAEEIVQLKALNSFVRKVPSYFRFASNVSDAWKIIQDDNNHVDLVLTDFNMPGGKSDLLIQKIRENEETKEIPVILASGGELFSGLSEIEANARFISLIFMGNLPNNISFQGNLKLNPFGNVSDGNDFFYENQLTEAKLIVDVPLRIAASELTLRDTLSVEIATDVARASSLTLDIQNAFPMEWKLNLSTLSGVIVASNLLVQIGNSIDALAVPTSTTLQIPISEAQWNAIRAEGEIIMQVVSNTPSYPLLNQIEFE